MYVLMYVCMSVCMYACMYVYICIYIYVYKYSKRLPVFKHSSSVKNNAKEVRKKQDRQCTYNVTLRRVRATIVGVEKQ